MNDKKLKFIPCGCRHEEVLAIKVSRHWNPWRLWLDLYGLTIRCSCRRFTE